MNLIDRALAFAAIFLFLFSLALGIVDEHRVRYPHFVCDGQPEIILAKR